MLLILAAKSADGVAFRRPGAVFKRSFAPVMGTRSTVGRLDDELSNAPSGETAAVDSAAADEWAAKLRTPRVQALRADLIEQYLKLGRTREYAEKEVGEFLADPSRSRTWVRAQEMQDMPGWGFGRVSGTRGEPSASQIPIFVAFFVGGALLKFGAEHISNLL